MQPAGLHQNPLLLRVAASEMSVVPKKKTKKTKKKEVNTAPWDIADQRSSSAPYAQLPTVHVVFLVCLLTVYMMEIIDIFTATEQFKNLSPNEARIDIALLSFDDFYGLMTY